MNDIKQTRWLWVRHFPVAAKGIYIGQTDLDAAVPPLANAKSLSIPHDENTIWVTSPLKRAQQTMQWLKSSLCLPETDHVIAPEIMEQHFGTWEGQRYDAITDPMDWSRAEAIQPPQGETFLDVTKRVQAWITQATDAYAGRTVIAVCHAGPIRAALAHALTGTASNALRFHLDYGSLSQTSYVQYENNWSGRVDSVNGTIRN
jgi:alpha-ribazole phosphatase